MYSFDIWYWGFQNHGGCPQYIQVMDVRGLVFKHMVIWGSRTLKKTTGTLLVQWQPTIQCIVLFADPVLRSDACFTSHCWPWPGLQASTMRLGSSRTWCALIWLSDTCLRRRGRWITSGGWHICNILQYTVLAMIEDPYWKGYAIPNHPRWGNHGNSEISWLLGLM